MGLPKLVRDKIPEIIKDSGKSCKYKIASREEMKNLLIDKLLEEIEEFKLDSNVLEAADIYEVFLCLLSTSDIDFSDMINQSYYKRQERGAFDKRVVLITVEL